MKEHPYTETELVKGFVKHRIFNVSDADSMVWHQDEYGRKVFIKNGKGWALQLDNEMPTLLEVNKTYYIPKLVWHRAIPLEGCSDLEIIIRELKHEDSK